MACLLSHVLLSVLKQSEMALCNPVMNIAFTITCEEHTWETYLGLRDTELWTFYLGTAPIFFKGTYLCLLSIIRCS